MKNPNGYGSVFKLSGNRRKPWAVRLTVGWTDEGKQKYKYLGYYETRPEAISALAKYNDNPYDVDANRLTFSEMYKMYMESRRETSRSNFNKLTMSYNLSEPLHDKRFAELRKVHMQKVIDECGKSYWTKTAIRTLYNQMYRFALQNDLVHRNYAQFIEMSKGENLTKRVPFSKDGINLLWDNLDKECVSASLVMIYTGMRPGEVIGIETKNVFLEERYLIAGIKTDAGKDRLVPIHKRIEPLIKDALDVSDDILSFFDGQTFAYETLRVKFRELMDELGLEHRPHDCRHTFATMMDNVGANKVSIKKIMGHSLQDITDAVYTHKDTDELLKAVDLLD